MAAKETVETLLDIAKRKARKLRPGERRRCIVYLEELGESHSTRELAEIFGVGESVIAQDRKRILKLYATELTPAHALQFVADSLRGHDDLIRRARAGLRSTVEGTLMHQKYVEQLSQLELRRIKILQEIGVVAKELGHLNVSEEVWYAKVSEDGIVSVSQDPADAPPPADVSASGA